MYLTGTYLICRKTQNQNIFYGFFLLACEYGQALAGKHRQTKCRQEDAPAVINFQLRQHTSSRIFSYTENQNLRPAVASLTRLRRRSLPHGSYLMMAHYKQLLTYNHIVGICITFPALLRSGSSSASVFCIPQSKNASASASFHQYQLLAIKHSHHLF